MFSSKDHRQGGQTRVSPHDIVSSGLCIGCGGCVAGANRSDTKMRWDRYGQLKPSGPMQWLRERSAQFSLICPFSPSAQNETELAVAQFPTAKHNDRRSEEHTSELKSLMRITYYVLFMKKKKN